MTMKQGFRLLELQLLIEAVFPTHDHGQGFIALRVVVQDILLGASTLIFTMK